MTTRLPLLDLDADQLEQALRLGRAYRERFAAVAKQVLTTAESLDIAEDVARSTIVAECLLLAAYMHTNDKESFATMARWAFETAENTRTNEVVGRS